MDINKSQLVICCVCCLLSGCIDFNQSLWHSFKAQDQAAHPELEHPKPSDKQPSYDEYTRQRKKVLDEHSFGH